MNIFLKSYLVLTAIVAVLMIITIKVTEYLDTKPKTNKFRKWWSNHIVDLDNRYE